jgi:hypothetical protein
MDFLVVTTYKKNIALRVILDSMVENKYTDKNIVCIVDDCMGNAREVYEEFTSKIPKLVYTTGKKRMGIGVNKNRGIRLFLEEFKDCQYLNLSDDDIVYTAPGLHKRYRQVMNQEGISHITGYLGGEFDKVKEENGFFKLFPPAMTAKDIAYCPGVQGLNLYYKRDIVEKAKYFNKLPYFYGFEHSLYDCRVNRLEGRTPDIHPILLSSPKYFVTQEVPNDYEFNLEDVYKLNGPAYEEGLKTCIRGTNLTEYNHKLQMKDEYFIKNYD